MSPDSPLFGRITIGSARKSLGHAALSLLMIRAAEEIRRAKHRDDLLITLEFSPSKLPDSTVFDRASVIEQQVASHCITDLSAESPFPGITVGRVAAVMMTPEYAAYEALCEPDRRQGLTTPEIERIMADYFAVAPDCYQHFPKWID